MKDFSRLATRISAVDLEYHDGPPWLFFEKNHEPPGHTVHPGCNYENEAVQTWFKLPLGISGAFQIYGKGIT